jgi:hypothetical protein
MDDQDDTALSELLPILACKYGHGAKPWIFDILSSVSLSSWKCHSRHQTKQLSDLGSSSLRSRCAWTNGEAKVPQAYIVICSLTK